MVEKLKKIRKKKGYSQKNVAESLGMSKYCYNKRENGKVIFTIEEVKKIKQLFKLTAKDMDEIFFEK